MKSIKRFFLSALLLTAVALLMRSVGVSFSVYVSNTAGAEAMGLFSLIMSVFGFALTVASSGANLAVIRMVSDAIGCGDDGLIRKSMKQCIKYCLFFSILAALCLFFFSDFIGKEILKEERTILSLKILGLALPFIAITSVLSGYFTAVRRVYKNAIFQILEQFIKIGFTVWFFMLFLEKGIEYACIALVSADVISEISACLISYFLYALDKKKHIKEIETKVNRKEIKGKLYSIALPVAFSAYLRSALVTVEHILIPRGLRKSGANQAEALTSYGTLHSMVLPVVLYPNAILASFAQLLVPELSECNIKKEKTRLKYIVSRAFQFSILYSIGVSGVLIAFSGELGKIIYNSYEASNYISLIAPLVPIMYLDGVTDAMLKGLGEQVYSMNVNIIDATLSVILVVILLPRFGINGYIITIYITEIVNGILSILHLINVTGFRAGIFRIVFAPLLSILGATSIGRIAFTYLTPLSPIPSLVFGITIVISIYLLLTTLIGSVNKEDREWLWGLFKK